MNILADKLNKDILLSNKSVIEMLSNLGKNLFFPKGIISQTIEAKKQAVKINATIGIAKKNNKIIHFESLIKYFNGIKPEEIVNYSSSFGFSKLRKLWKSDLYKKNPSLRNKKISSPIVTSGITHAISIFSEMWIDENDVIIVPDMFWGNYNMIFNVKRNAKLSIFPFFNNKKTFNIEKFSEKIDLEIQKYKKITVLLNFPNNPTGYSPSKKEILQISEILIETAKSGVKILVLCDDAYFGLYYDNKVFTESIFSVLCNSNENLMAIKVDGCTKEYFSWGLRIGFITYGTKCLSIEKNKILYEALEIKTAGCVRGSISSVSNLSQNLIIKTLENKTSEQEKQKKFEILKKRNNLINKFCKIEKYSKVWETYTSNSGYFLCIRVKEIDARKLRLLLLKKYKVGVISIKNKYIRIAYSSMRTKDIKKIFEIIYFGIKELENADN